MRLEFSLYSFAERRRASRLAQSLLIADLLGPPRPLVVALTTWEEVMVIDNTQGGFSTICPDWPRGRVALSGVLLQFLRRGCPVHMAVQPGTHRPFVDRLLRDVERLGLDGLHLRDGEVTNGTICTPGFLMEGAIDALLAGTAEGTVRFDTDAEVASARCHGLQGAP